MRWNEHDPPAKEVMRARFVQVPSLSYLPCSAQRYNHLPIVTRVAAILNPPRRPLPLWPSHFGPGPAPCQHERADPRRRGRGVPQMYLVLGPSPNRSQLPSRSQDAGTINHCRRQSQSQCRPIPHCTQTRPVLCSRASRSDPCTPHGRKRRSKADKTVRQPNIPRIFVATARHCCSHCVNGGSQSCHPFYLVRFKF